MKTLTRINLIAIAVSVILSVFLMGGHHFMPTPDEALSGYSENQWQPVYKDVQKGFVKVETPSEALLKIVTLARLGYTGCIADPNSQGWKFSCFFKGRYLSMLPLAYIWLTCGLVSIVTGRMWSLARGKKMFQLMPDHKVKRYHYWPRKNPHRYMGSYAYWSILSAKDKRIYALNVVFGLLVLLWGILLG